MLAYDDRGRYWWYGSRGWTFPPIFHFILLPCGRWQQRGCLTSWHLPRNCGWSKGCHWSPPCGKNDTHWHFLMLNECWWRPNSECEHSEVVSSAFQQWQCWKTLFCSWEFVLSKSVIVLFAAAVVSMEINRRHYFSGNQHTYVYKWCTMQLLTTHQLTSSGCISPQILFKWYLSRSTVSWPSVPSQHLLPSNLITRRAVQAAEELKCPWLCATLLSNNLNIHGVLSTLFFS